MGQKQRMDMIRKRLMRDKKVVVGELSRECGVTEETIRRDLDRLVAEGIAARTYGGAVLRIEDDSESVDYVRRSRTHTEEKEKIASLAADLIPDRVSIAADSSTTVFEVIQKLRDREKITVLTYSARIIREHFETGMTIIATGGSLDRNTCSMQGALAKKTLGSYNTDIALISCKALGTDGSIYDSHEEENELKKIMIERSARVFLLVDHFKFGKTAFARMGSLQEIDAVITDEEPSARWKGLLDKLHVQLICPGQA